MTQPTEATIAASVVEPSAPAALTLTRRAPGATPWKPDLRIVAGDDPGHVRPVPVGVEVGQVAVAALVGEVGALDDLALGGQRRHRDHARVDHGDVDAAARGARLVGADRLADVGERRAGRGGGGGRVLGLAVGPALHRAVDDDAGHAVRRAEGALGAGRHLCDESVDDRQRLPDRAAVALDGALRRGELVGLGAHDHRLQRAMRSPAREEEQRDRRRARPAARRRAAVDGDDRRRDPNEFPTPRS